MSFELAPTRDGTRLAYTSDHLVRIWDSKAGRECLSLKGHASNVLSVAFSPDGRRIASGGGDRTVKLWDTRTGQERLTFKGHAGAVDAACFSPDGKTVASASGDLTVKLWDAQTGKERATLKNGVEQVTRWLSARTARRWPRADIQTSPSPATSGSGTSPAASNAPSSRDIPNTSTASPSVRTAKSSPAPARTRRSSCGTLDRPDNEPDGPATPSAPGGDIPA